MRITFHLGEDEVSRFEIASHVWRGDAAGSPKTRRGSSAAAIGRCERGHELRLAGPRAGEDASGCPDAPARDSREGG